MNAPGPHERRYAVVRFGGAPPDVWASLSSVMFADAATAWEFARRLDYAQVYELVPVVDHAPG